MTSREVAEVTGKLHKNVLQDIDNLMKSGGCDLSHEIHNDIKLSEYVDSRGKTYRQYVMTQDGVLLLTTGYSPELRMKVIKRWRELEDRPAAPVKQPALTDSAPEDRAVAALRFLNMVVGIDPGIAAAVALEHAEHVTGSDMTVLKRALPAKVEKPAGMNATAVGQRLGISVREANGMLLDAGFQYRDERGDWTLTDAGAEHAETLPYTRNGHAGYQILWRGSVVDVLRNTAGFWE